MFYCHSTLSDNLKFSRMLLAIKLFAYSNIGRYARFSVQLYKYLIDHYNKYQDSKLFVGVQCKYQPEIVKPLDENSKPLPFRYLGLVENLESLVCSTVHATRVNQGLLSISQVGSPTLSGGRGYTFSSPWRNAIG